MSPETRREIIKWIVQSALGLVVYGAILFLAAGSLDWIWGWVLVAVLAAFLAAHPLILIPINPELLAQREKGLREKGVKTWDRWVAFFGGGIMPILSWIVAGLDVRFGWTAPMPLAVHLTGLVVMVSGYALFLWAMASNAFFAEGVRIQSERDHTVVTGGPYRFVRHPGYSGAILSFLSTPLLLGSMWTWIPVLGGSVLYVVRTALEDRTLRAELPGYEAFTRQTQYRLVPGVW